MAQRSGVIFVLIGAIGYALLPIWVKNILPSGLGPLDIATWRFTFAAPIVWLLLWVWRTSVPDKPLPRKQLLGLGVLLAGAALSAFFGLERVPASTFILLFYSYPAMVALINFALGERLPAQSWLALGLTTVGVALTVPDFGAGLTSDAWLGIAIAFVNAAFVAVYFILNNRLLAGHTAARRASAWAINGAFLVMLATSLIREVAVPPDTKTWVLLLCLALFSTVMPIFMFMVGIQRLGASRAAIVSTVEPVGTLLLAAVLLGETLQPVQWLGGAIILSSVVTLQLSRRKPAPAPVPAAGD